MTIDMLHFQQLIFKWSEKRKQSTSAHSRDKLGFLCVSRDVDHRRTPRKLMSCEAPDWIDDPIFTK